MMERRPELTIIAGPNGAGKSRLCPLYVSTVSFDGDKLMMNLRKEHPDWPDRWISGTVASELEKQKAKALTEKTDFAFETNFSSEMVVGMVNEFKAAGFKVTLCYFGLLSEDDSVSRVTNSDYGHIVALHIAKSNIHRVEDNPPQWFKEQFEEAFAILQ